MEKHVPGGYPSKLGVDIFYCGQYNKPIISLAPKSAKVNGTEFGGK